MSANGRVCTGYSYPMVAIYDPETDTYSGGRPLGRGVSDTMSIEAASTNKFRADNQDAEKAPGKFGGGSGTSTIDGLLLESERMIYGLPAPGTGGIVEYNDDMQIPYCGYGYVKQWQSDGVVTWEPWLYRKVQFKLFGEDAATQEEEIDWQTQALEYDVFRADDAKHSWRRHGQEYTTEAEAFAKLKEMLNISTQVGG